MMVRTGQASTAGLPPAPWRRRWQPEGVGNRVRATTEGWGEWGGAALDMNTYRQGGTESGPNGEAGPDEGSRGTEPDAGLCPCQPSGVAWGEWLQLWSQGSRGKRVCPQASVPTQHSPHWQAPVVEQTVGWALAPSPLLPAGRKNGADGGGRGGGKASTTGHAPPVLQAVATE